MFLWVKSFENEKIQVSYNSVVGRPAKAHEGKCNADEPF